jgi:hypothetical protein
MNLLANVDGWEVEVLGLSERGAIDTVALHSQALDQHYARVRFDRGKLMFLDTAPLMSVAAREELALALGQFRGARAGTADAKGR